MASTKTSKKEADAQMKNIAEKNPPLTDEELNAEVVIILTTCNPYMSSKCVEFDRKTNTFKPVNDFRKQVVSYHQKGSLNKKIYGEGGIVYDLQPKKTMMMKNKFNFRDDYSETMDPVLTDQNECTDQSLHFVKTFSGCVSKRWILMAYQEDAKPKEEKEEQKSKWVNVDSQTVNRFIGRKEFALQDASVKYLRLCERMLDQNMSEANLDLGFYDNPNDDFKANAGSLLPLWGVSYPAARAMSVSALAWNSHYADLFAVGYREQKESDEDLSLVRERGLICVFSLKGPSHPEWSFRCDSGVSHLHFHPGSKHLLAAAFADSRVAVFDLRQDDHEVWDSKFDYSHHDRVAEIQWLSHLMPQKFCSISYDGRIINWLHQMNDLSPCYVVTPLTMKEPTSEVLPSGIEMSGEVIDQPVEDLGLYACGTSLSLSPSEHELAVAGTITGQIRQVSLQELRCGAAFSEHRDSVRRVRCNPFRRGVFLSCGRDLSLQLWDVDQSQSVFEFFFENGVEDVAWAPYSSTLFAAVSGNAVVNVFELAFNTKEPVATYSVYTPKQDAYLTTIQFHPNQPVILVGDDRGYVVVLKTSPNLRTSLKASTSMGRDKYVAGEVDKLQKLIVAAQVVTM